ncbi:carbohydrate ABC transporter permease [Mumia sp. zg.B53]|uniref:carbohydrate ABC transporter permease n=1 Tax=unclassified Mumia TaxID=2621872 RepID=UPI001C6F2819|nr:MULTISPECIES: carbohydrate ABC transporter permease [unclassified Mumia]MBW9207916.1 carbohydrate ABC transporter permease [Mumia sp. zg.B17]MBW9209738.1 carbohydrate ABC transporter permease [Mumia sp. zg.B21]MBW9214341.1 carbohydrate ABC transporter permease [Mumia sp. zg.B53]MDD9348390.1 carbohydrate ABC transporter permease [Mumia sp.]
MTTPLTTSVALPELVDEPDEPPHRRRGRSRLHRASPLTYLTLTFVLIASVAPLYYMVVMASRPNSDITSNPPPITPGGELRDNVTRVFDNPDVVFAQALLNSLLVSLVATITVVTLSALAGFAFAKLRFRGKNVYLLAVIGTMMVPVQLGLVPLYMLMGWVGLAGSLWSAVLPFLVTGFGVFFMRQYIIQAIPDELIEAARVDGASTFRIFAQIIFPALRPAVAVLGLLTFMERWNDFMWPYLTLSPENPTVQVALSRLSGGYYTDQALVMAGTLLATVPLVLVFVLFGRRIVGGIMEGGVKA